MKNRKSINAVAAVLIAAAWSGLYLFLHPQPPATDEQPHEAVGAMLAEQALSRLEPGARILVFARDPKPYAVPASAAQLNGFLHALKKSGRTVAGTRWFKLDPLRLVAVPPEDFFDQLRHGKDNDVIVSFLGPPRLDERQLAQLGNKRPPVLAVCPGARSAQAELRRLFDQKLLAAAVIDRLEAPAPGPAGSLRDGFERHFRLITAANLAELPEPGMVAN
jgi:hypothetical protein